MYEVGKVYVWQNLREHTSVNGSETTVIGLPEKFELKGSGGVTITYCETDTILPDGRVLYATHGELRPKSQPTGEQLVRDLFEPKPAMVPA